MNIQPSILFPQILHCLSVFAAFIIPAVLLIIPIRFLTRIPPYVFRKLLHGIAFTCVTLMILSAKSWAAAALTSVLIAVAIYPLLSAFENAPWYEKLFVQKSVGETKKSLLLLFFMFAVLISVSWGLFGKPAFAAAAVLMWGTGDAAAALVGIPYGRHKVHSHFTDGKKSWEGSLSMLAISFVSGLIVLSAAEKLPLPQAALFAGLGALSGTATELFSPSEYDTVTVPAVIAAVLLLLEHR